MFNAPKIFELIPDIAQIYEINEKQCEELEKAIEVMDDNICMETMHEDAIERWEQILGITSLDNDTLEDRRFRVRTKVNERLPYSYRVIAKKFDSLCPGGYLLTISDDRKEVEVKLSLKSKKMLDDVKDMCENILPLNMCYWVSILWNQYATLGRLTHEQLSQRTYRQIREEVFG